MYVLSKVYLSGEALQWPMGLHPALHGSDAYETWHASYCGLRKATGVESGESFGV
jgi:hypothetical protein